MFRFEHREEKHALFSGLVFIALAGFLVAPVAHRVLHRFHYEGEDEKNP
jgi:hypothetical protein